MFFKNFKNEQDSFVIDFHATIKSVRKELQGIISQIDQTQRLEMYKVIMTEMLRFLKEILFSDLNLQDIIQHHQYVLWFKEIEELNK